MYEELAAHANEHGVYVYEKTFKSRAKGLIKGNRIGISSSIATLTEKACVLAEELGHFHTTVGDILDQSNVDNRKQERRAREWAYNYLLPLHRFVDAHRARVKGRHEIAEYFGVTEEFLQACIDRYMDKHGLFVVVDERHTIMFDPLAVVERFE